MGDNAIASEVIVGEVGRAGIIRLNRPKALNAVTHGMIQTLQSFLNASAKAQHIYGIVLEGEGKAFCAGGDIRTIYEKARADPAAIAKFYADEYQYNWSLNRFRKPHVALIDGVVMGGGVGISIHGTHRVGGSNMRFAMPETGIGFFPDVGGSWFLPRFPGELGMYLGLTGKVIGQADAFYCGALTHCVAGDQFDRIKAAMSHAEPIDIVLDELHKAPPSGDLDRVRPEIDRWFSASTLSGIFQNLENETGAQREFAHETLSLLQKKSPLSLHATFAQLRRGREHRSLKDSLVMEYRLASRFIREPDLFEGIRAVIIDKDHAPKWDAASIHDVSDARVQALFEPLPEGDLALIDT